MASILIVDDDSFFRQHVTNILVDAGYEVMQARNSAEGEALLSENPDLVIVDYRMPGLDGVEWIKKLRSYGVRVPIVFCSGSGCDQGKFSVVRNLLQVSLIVQKPIKPAELLAQIARILPLEPRHFEAETQPVSLPNELTPGSGNSTHSGFDDLKEQGGCADIAGDRDGMESDSDSQSLDSLIRELNSEQVDEAAEIEGDLKSLVVEYARDLIDSVEQIRLDIVRGLELEPTLAMPAGEMAHRIAGTAGSLGLSDISHLAGKIEHLIFDNCEIADESRLPQQKAALVLALELAEQAAVVVAAYNNGGATAVEYSEPQSGELSKPEVPVIGVYETGFSSVENSVSLEHDGIDETHSVGGVSWVASEVVRKLLVVTTDFVLYRTIEQILEGERYYLVCADSRDSAIFELARLRPDVVLLDQATDFVGSGDLCGFIRKNVGLDVCLLTLLSSVAGKRWALDAGFDDFLILPIEKEELLWRLSSPGRRAVGKSTENDHLDQQAHSHW